MYFYGADHGGFSYLIAFIKNRGPLPKKTTWECRYDIYNVVNDHVLYLLSTFLTLTNFHTL